MSTLRADIPLPDDAGAPGRRPSLPFLSMAVGESFPVSAERLHAVRVSVSRYNKKGHSRFQVASIASGRGKQWRCWRVE